MIQLYEYSRGNERFRTQYGNIAYLDWLHREKERIELASGRKAEIREYRKKVGLFVDNVSGALLKEEQ